MYTKWPPQRRRRFKFITSRHSAFSQSASLQSKLICKVFSCTLHYSNMANEMATTNLIEVKIVPAATAPPGLVSNFVNPPNHAKLALSVWTTCISLITIFVFSRMYVKLFVVKKLHIEDWILPIPYVSLASSILRLFDSMTAHTALRNGSRRISPS